MTKRRIIPMLFLCCLIALLSAQALSHARSANRSARASADARRRRITDTERKREAARRRAQKQLESERDQRESEKMRADRSLQSQIERGRKTKESQERLVKIKKEFLHEKYALRATEEQWKVIKAKLEKVQHLRDQTTSTVRVFLTSSSSRRSVPTWQWMISWKDKAPAELTEAQKIANTLMDLVDSNNIKAEEFKKKMDALRESRRRQEKLKKQLSEAQEELREVLTIRQEAALVLKGWL